MEIVKVDEIFNIKGEDNYLAGKFSSEEDAQYAIDNIKIEDFDCLWLYVISQDRDVVIKEDIDIFKIVPEKEEVETT